MNLQIVIYLFSINLQSTLDNQLSRLDSNWASKPGGLWFISMSLV